ncbi:MAG: HPr family phosphocarrier protein [Pseudonocardiaceae bacterium]|nr:HPr family phosphocarrier protein [Pseudonocardiaceae bacterium]
MTVGLVLVSHSAALAEGLAELATQMAPDVPVIPAGGLRDGEHVQLGTDYDEVCAALERAEDGDGVLLLYDLGSARMTADLAVETAEGTHRAAVVEAPFVEGTVAAAVAAQGAADLDGVLGAAASASGGPQPQEQPAPPAEDGQRTEFVLGNEVGLHARPAALFARSVAELDASVEVRLGEQTAQGNSVLGLMALGAVKGDRIEVLASGPQADEALARIRQLVDRNFDE